MRAMVVSNPERLLLSKLCCRFDAVIHFAGRKAVGESVQFPMLYYTHNVCGAVNLIEVMRKHICTNVSHIELQCSSCLGAILADTNLHLMLIITF